MRRRRKNLHLLSHLVLKVLGVPLGQSLDRRAGSRVAAEGSEDVELDTRVVGLYHISNVEKLRKWIGEVSLTV